jgi:hypothetical protein
VQQEYQPLAYAGCMRKHGAENFPDPTEKLRPGFTGTGYAGHLGRVKTQRQFGVAQKVCAHPSQLGASL